MTDHEYGALVRQWNYGRENKVNIIQQKIPVPVNQKEFAENFGEGSQKLKSYSFLKLLVLLQLFSQ